MFHAHVMRAAVGCPSDLEQEAAAVEKAINDWNREHSEEIHIVLLPSRWKTDVSHLYGEAPQTIINRSMIDTCNLLVAFFGETLGTATADAISGTVEEIERVHKAGKLVFVYFGKRQINIDTIDTAKLDALREFKKFCQDKAFYGTFTDAADLAQQVQRDLLREMRKLRFTLEPDYTPLPSNYLLEGDQLTLRTRLDYLDHFSNQPGGESVILENVLVLLSAQKVSNMRDLMPVLEAVARKQEPLLIIAPEIEGEALATLATNRARGTLEVCPVNFRAKERETLLQIKKFTGGQLFGDLLLRLDHAQIEYLGHVSKVIVERDRTRIWRAIVRESATSGGPEGV